MPHGQRGKRRRAGSDWAVQPLEGRVLLSQSGARPPSASTADVGASGAHLRTTTKLQASTQVAGRRPSVTLIANVSAPGIGRPVSSGLVRFSVVSPTPESLGVIHPNPRGDAKLKTSRLNFGATYVIQAKYVSPNGAFASSSTQLDVSVAPSPATHFRITAPRYFGAPGTPITYTVTALDRTGQPVTDYTGTIQFSSPTDKSATYLSKTYTFTTADHGRHQFPDGVTFHKGGAEILKVSQVNNTRIVDQQDFGIE